MRNFNLDEYELVEDRIRRFYEDYPDGRIVTYNHTTQDDRARGYFIVRAEIFTDHDDQHADCPKATGLAFEIEGGQGANRTSALENAETSAIGRALANADYAKGKRPSRSEMAKVIQGEAIDAQLPIWQKQIDAALTVDELQKVWEDAVAKGVSDRIIKQVNQRKRELSENQTEA